MKKILLLLVTLSVVEGLYQPCVGQNVNTDSLWAVWKDEKQQDSLRLNALINYNWSRFIYLYPDSAVHYAQVAFEFAKKARLTSQMAQAKNTEGVAYFNLGNFVRATENYNDALDLYRQVNDLSGIASTYNNLANVYKKKGNINEALDYHLLSLSIREKTGDVIGKARSLSNIANIFMAQGRLSDAIDNYKESERLYELANDKMGYANVLLNIGILNRELGNTVKALDYLARGLKVSEEIGNKYLCSSALRSMGFVSGDIFEYEKADQYFLQSLKIAEDMNDKFGTSRSLSALGHNCLLQKKYKESLNYSLRALKLAEEMEEMETIPENLNNIAKAYYFTNEYQKGMQYSSRSLSLAKQIGVGGEIRDAANTLYKLYRATDQPEKALEMHELYLTMKDSIEGVENQREILKKQYQYEYEKEALTDSLEFSKKEAVLKEQTEKQKLGLFVTIAGLGLVSIFSMLIYNRFRVTRKQKKVIEVQKVEVEEKNKKITDSIEYALRIQTAILPPDKLVKEYLKNSFVLYLPKDIVAGDFYWMETMEVKGDEGRRTSGNPSSLATRPSSLVLFAACDCTGHGVPGAMVSVMCHNALNRAVREYNLTAPAKILDKVVDLVQDNFTKSDEEIQDGMDASLCAYYPEEKKLQWAGANNPLWIIRNGEITEYKPDKQPIGKYDYRKPYTNHEIELQEGDTIYIFSDGYHDQFGDDGEKKLTKKGLRKILLGIQNKPMNEQRAELLNLHNQWKGQVEQIDDICVIGVRV